MDLSLQVTDDDINEIIQIDGTGDTASSDEIGSTRDVDENKFLGITDAGDLKVLEETSSISNEDSMANSSDNEDPQVDLVEEVRIIFELKLLKIYSICTLIYFGTKRNNN